MAARLLAFLSLAGVALLATAASSGYANNAEPENTCPEPVAPKTIRVWGREFNQDDDPSKNILTGYFRELLDNIKRVTPAENGGFNYELSVHNDLGFYNKDGSFGGTIFNCIITKDCDMVVGAFNYDLIREKALGINLALGDYWLTLLVSSNFYDPKTVKYISQENNDLAYLKTNEDPAIRAIWESVEAGRPGSIVADELEGVSRVAGGYNLALLTSTPNANNLAANHPGVKPTHVGIVNRYWGVAVQPCSPLVELVDRAEQTLKQEGTLLELAKKYGVDKYNML